MGRRRSHSIKEGALRNYRWRPDERYSLSPQAQKYLPHKELANEETVILLKAALMREKFPYYFTNQEP